MSTEEAPGADFETVLRRAAEKTVMADPEDASSLSDLARTLEELSGALADSHPRYSRVAASAGSLADRIAAREVEHPQEDFTRVDETLAALQAVLIHDRSEAEVVFPEGMDPGREDGETGGGPSGTEESLTPDEDPDMLLAFVAQQDSVLPDIEENILAFEKDGNQEALEELRRLVHTVKGEAGAMGLDRISDACHITEDYIQASESTTSADALLGFKDWFEQAVEALRQGRDIPPFDDIARKMEEREDMEHETDPSEERDEGGDDDEPGEELGPIPIEDPELAGDFVSESQEHFDIVDENLITLESDPTNDDALSAVFRAFHTIKGTCNFLGITPVGELAHKAENVLDSLRKGELQFKGPVVEAVFSAQDMLKKLISGLSRAISQNTDFVPDREMAQVDRQLQKILDGEITPTDSHAASAAPNDSPTGTEPARETQSSQSSAPSEPTEPSGDEQAAEASRQQQASATGPSQGGTELKQTMKIDADKIDHLLDTIGELVIVESMVSQSPELQQIKSPTLDRHLGQLNKISRSLQDMGMSMRMIPIDATFRKMGRLVRDLSKKSGKKVELSLEGKETELDKAMVEKLGDPLVHMVRNAVDHGIESTPEERRAAGKPEQGHVTLKAYQEGGSIHIAISDDGKGLDREKIANKAIERGIIKSAEDMSDEEVHALIFEPGFSTSGQITDVSGRGVGMDVVKNAIEGMRGNIRINSVPGKGSTFTLVLPLTMAIIEGMVVRVGQERYILPLLSIIESFRPSREDISTVTRKGETVPFRGHLLSLFRLGRLFNIPDAETDPVNAILVVIEHSGRQMALMVDELLGQNQTVIKNLGEAMGNIEGIAGASIMPDGSPGLILDVNGIIKMATRG
jgi:two-component system chemotaxis sensor kinase CheA